PPVSGGELPTAGAAGPPGKVCVDGRSYGLPLTHRRTRQEGCGISSMIPPPGAIASSESAGSETPRRESPPCERGALRSCLTSFLSPLKARYIPGALRTAPRLSRRRPRGLRHRVLTPGEVREMGPDPSTTSEADEGSGRGTPVSPAGPGDSPE